MNIRGSIVNIGLTILFILFIFSATFEPSLNSPLANQLFNNINAKVTKEFFINTLDQTSVSKLNKTQLSFAAFTDTHIGASYQYFFRIPRYISADYLDHLGDDLVNYTNKLDFAVHLGDIINHNTAQVNGIGLPPWVNQYKNNLKAYLISHVNLPFHFVIGNHDINDYELNKGDPHNLTKSLTDETSMNSPVYAMMRDGILFLVVPELGYITWTHPIEYEWIEFMVSQYPNSTTIILSHQAIEDTTKEDKLWPYRGKQDMDWWSNLFQNNPQIKICIHGHNHCLDWYIGNQSTGITPNNTIYEFGHEMVFSSPYAQLDWGNYHEEDRIVIYNISKTGITTATWENNGDGGHWVSEYNNSWNISTTFDPKVKDWYSFPVFLQDNETQLIDMKLLSTNITMQLVGTVPMELFYDPYMESPNGWSDEIILGFGDDRTGNVERKENESGMKVLGPTFITFPDKHPDNYLLDHPNLYPILSYLLKKYPNFFPIFRNILELFINSNQEDGRSGQPYQCFPMGTISAAVANQTYNFSMTARSNSGDGRFKMNVSCCDWNTKSQYSVLPDSEKQVLSHIFGSNYETIYGKYTVPNNKNAWFLQGKLDFLDSTDYDVSFFSVKRQRNSDTTDDFHLWLSSNWYNVSATLQENEMVNFSINPQTLCDAEGVMNFTALINGNKYGLVNMIYHEPILLSRNARFKVNSYSNGVFNLSLTKTISRHSKIFKIFPFSTDSIYDNLNIIADDGSGMKHYGRNENLWLSCNSPVMNHRFVEVTL